MATEQDHPLKGYKESEKIDYLSLLACIAAADGEVDDDEINSLRSLAKLVGLSGKGRAAVLSAAEDPSSVEVGDVTRRLSSSELRFTLITDMYLVAYADDSLDKEEVTEIKGFAKNLKVKDDQLQAIHKYAQALHKAKDAKGNDDKWKNLGGEVAAGLASAGVPVAAVAVSGSVFGLSAAGITSGLAALGMGLGMASGVGAAAAIGIASYFGVKWLYKKITG